jgi:Arc/MetJ family transcription regulator
VPFLSKVTGVPMVDLATRVMLGEPVTRELARRGDAEVIPLHAVEAARAHPAIEGGRG